MPPEVRAAMLATLQVALDRLQTPTRASADRRYRRWTAGGDELVLARDVEADREVALELGRAASSPCTSAAVCRANAPAPALTVMIGLRCPSSQVGWNRCSPGKW